MVPGKKNPRKIGPSKIVLRQKNARKFERLFFIFIDWFHYTRKKMFDVHLTILHYKLYNTKGVQEGLLSSFGFS